LVKYDFESYTQIFNQKTDKEIKAIFVFETEEELEKKKNKVKERLSFYYQFLAHFQLERKPDGQFIGSAGFNNWHPFHQKADWAMPCEKKNIKTRDL
jgi:RimJ/RimL family protein N-acetyltransferase